MCSVNSFLKCACRLLWCLSIVPSALVCWQADFPHAVLCLSPWCSGHSEILWWQCCDLGTDAYLNSVHKQCCLSDHRKTSGQLLFHISAKCSWAYLHPKWVKIHQTFFFCIPSSLEIITDPVYLHLCIRNLEQVLIVTILLPGCAFINSLSQPKASMLLLKEDVLSILLLTAAAWSRSWPSAITSPESGAAFPRLASSDLGQCRAGGRNTWRKKVGGIAPFDNSFSVGWFKLLVELCPNPVLLQRDWCWVCFQGELYRVMCIKLLSLSR